MCLQCHLFLVPQAQSAKRDERLWDQEWRIGVKQMEWNLTTTKYLPVTHTENHKLVLVERFVFYFGPPLKNAYQKLDSLQINNHSSKFTHQTVKLQCVGDINLRTMYGKLISFHEIFI